MMEHPVTEYTAIVAALDGNAPREKAKSVRCRYGECRAHPESEEVLEWGRKGQRTGFTTFAAAKLVRARKLPNRDCGIARAGAEAD